MRAAARAVADADLASAVIGGWLAGELAKLRQEDVAAVEAWLAAARRRAEAGADAPYEPTLIAGELDRARVELIAARREQALAWGELAARADVPPQPQALDLSGLPAGRASGAMHEAVAAGIEARRRVATALARFEASAFENRWGVAGEVGAEGDDRVAHLGLAYRFPLHGERGAVAATLAAAEAAAERDAELRRAAWRARVSAAEAARASSQPSVDAAELDRALAALALRVDEGKERASEVLPLRRQILEARVASLRARAAALLAGTDLYFLAGEASR